jgi:hypothetical protein
MLLLYKLQQLIKTFSEILFQLFELQVQGKHNLLPTVFIVRSKNTCLLILKNPVKLRKKQQHACCVEKKSVCKEEQDQARLFNCSHCYGNTVVMSSD